MNNAKVRDRFQRECVQRRAEHLSCNDGSLRVGMGEGGKLAWLGKKQRESSATIISGGTDGLGAPWDEAGEKGETGLLPLGKKAARFNSGKEKIL